MRNAIALHITDIHPDMNIESEIFPKELTRDAQQKDVFTPPNHQQMRFTESKDKEEFPPQYADEDAFFITEDIRADDVREKKKGDDDQNEDAIEEEKSYATEGDDESNTAKKRKTENQE